MSYMIESSLKIESTIEPTIKPFNFSKHEILMKEKKEKIEEEKIKKEDAEIKKESLIEDIIETEERKEETKKTSKTTSNKGRKKKGAEVDG